MEFVGDLMNEPWLKAFMFPASGRLTLTVKDVRKAEVAFDDQEPKNSDDHVIRGDDLRADSGQDQCHSIDQAFGQ